MVAAICHHALLGLSVAALVSAGWRVASLLTPSGLERLLVSAVLAVVAAAGEAIVLGLVHGGTNPVGLPLVAGLTWFAVYRWVPAPVVGIPGSLAASWRARTVAERVLLGALAGVGVAWASWQLRHPALGLDTVQYHLPEIVIWAQHGRPGAIEPVLRGLPVGNYPLTNEVILAWGVGTSRSFVLVTLWPWVTLALTAAAGWLGLRSLAVPRPAAAAAVGALCAQPHLLAWQSTGGMTDPPALAWLVVCAALCLVSVRRPALLAPALLAGALSVGTKTTTLPLVALTLGMTLWVLRSRLGAVRAPVALASAAALLVGGGWYVRNLVQHGSPFWPLLAAPWGDPLPPLVQALNTTFLERPGATIHRLGHLYLHRFGGGLAILGGGLLAPLLVRRRSVAVAGVATGLGLLFWSAAPVTGVAKAILPQDAQFSTTRYLLPLLASGALAIALSARASRLAAWLATAVLTTAFALGIGQTLRLGSPVAPPLEVPLLGAVIGALVALTARGLALGARAHRFQLMLGPRVRALGGAASALALGAALSIPATGYGARQAATRDVLASGVMQWLASEPGFRHGRQPVEMTTPLGLAAGDRLAHAFVLLSPGQSCAQTVRLAAGGWLVVSDPLLDGPSWSGTRRCLSTLRPAFRSSFFTAYRVAATAHSTSR